MEVFDTEYKVGQLIRYSGSVYKVVGFDHGIPLLNEVKTEVQFT
jgi:hypothetical protein